MPLKVGDAARYEVKGSFVVCWLFLLSVTLMCFGYRIRIYGFHLEPTPSLFQKAVSAPEPVPMSPAPMVSEVNTDVRELLQLMQRHYKEDQRNMELLQQRLKVIEEHSKTSTLIFPSGDENNEDSDGVKREREILRCHEKSL